MDNVKINQMAIRTIESIVSKGDRAEIIPVKDGVRVMRIRRNTMYIDQKEDRP